MTAMAAVPTKNSIRNTPICSKQSRCEQIGCEPIADTDVGDCGTTSVAVWFAIVAFVNGSQKGQTQEGSGSGSKDNAGSGSVNTVTIATAEPPTIVRMGLSGGEFFISWLVPTTRALPINAAYRRHKLVEIRAANRSQLNRNTGPL